LSANLYTEVTMSHITPGKKQQSDKQTQKRHKHTSQERPSTLQLKLLRTVKVVISILAIILLFLGGLYIAWDRELSQVTLSKDNFYDVARLHPTKVLEVHHETKEADLIAVVKDASAKNLKISIAGSQHSQGGHTYYPDAVVLDMKSYDEVISFDKKNKTITVEAGANWQKVQDYIAPHRLAVKRMQSSYVFTVGGTLSANAHGRDLDGSSVVESVRQFRLLKADGTVVTVSRKQNPELFGAVIGGYGMFGVILDVTLDLVKDDIYEKRSVDVGYNNFPDYFRNNLQSDPTTAMMLVRPDVDPGSDQFLKNMVVSTWHTTEHTAPELYELTGEKNVIRDKVFFDMSRRYDWAKSLRWSLQKDLVEKSGANQYISRNNAMRPSETPLAFLDYRPVSRTDLIQEYYVPINEFVGFMDKFRDIITEDKVNIISSTIRYVKANDEIMLPYASKQDAFSVIVMSNISLDKQEVLKAERSTQRLVDAAIAHKGTHYLTYQLFPTKEQLKQEYPNIDKVFALKRKYDPKEVFMNEFYAKYAQGKEVEYGGTF
jgi:decaprenylphospho-beta-D-ribofuranose 2-oxidase